MEKYIDQHGREWIEPSCCSVGDYAGAGTVGRSNISYIEEHFADHITTEYAHRTTDWRGKFFVPDEDTVILRVLAPYNYETILVRSGVLPELDEIVDALEDYPVIDESRLSELEAELEEKQVIDSWFISDMLREAEKQGLIRKETLEELDAYANTLDDDTQWTLYRYASDETNSYPWFENFNACFDTRALAPVWTRRLIEMYKSHLATLNHDATGAQ